MTQWKWPVNWPVTVEEQQTLADDVDTVVEEAVGQVDQRKRLDRERSDVAAHEVQAWRRSGRLPFPRLSAARMAQLEGTLDYPPRGSVDAFSASAQLEPEPLSTEPLSTEPRSRQRPAEPQTAEAPKGERHRS